jgi:hypothetical protein
MADFESATSTIPSGSHGERVNIKELALIRQRNVIFSSLDVKGHGELMETSEIYRGRLIDHLHLIVKDVKASQNFYKSVLQTLNISLSGVGVDFLWADELFISSKDSKGAMEHLTGRTHLALQAKGQECSC